MTPIQKITAEVDPDGRGLLDFQEVTLAFISLLFTSPHLFILFQSYTGMYDTVYAIAP